MISAADTKHQIDELVGYLVRVGLSVDQNLPHLRRTIHHGMEVTFPKAEHVSIAMKDRAYSEIYAHMAGERAFITKLPDGALIQMRYYFTNRSLQSHILGFFPSPHLEEFQNNPDVYLEDELYADVIAKHIFPIPLRFDFDARHTVARPIMHPKSHFTLGQYDNCRIPVSAPLSPYCFLSFVLRNFYHTAFSKYADDMPFFRECFEDSILADERKVVHLQIPVSET